MWTVLEDKLEAEKGGMGRGNEKISKYLRSVILKVASAVFNLVSQKNGEGLLSIHNKDKRKG